VPAGLKSGGGKRQERRARLERAEELAVLRRKHRSRRIVTDTAHEVGGMHEPRLWASAIAQGGSPG
jgi:hypothetical protein